MEQFDPDKFLTQDTGFDPDAFLADSYEPSEEVLPQIVEEMHPAVSWKDRAVVKNFGTPEGSLKYLKEKYPNLEVKQHGNRVLFKGANEKEYRVLDPDAEGIDFGMENIYDLMDVGTDVAQGIGEGAATVGGALLAGAGTAGAGALAGGMAAGGAAGAGLETLKQRIAQELGVRDEMSGSDIAFSGGFGALSPLAFGTGAGLKASAKSGMKGIMSTLSEKGVLGNAASGVKNQVAPKIAEFTSGLPSKVFKTYKDNVDEITNMTDEDMITKSIDVFNTIEEGAKGLKHELGDQYNTLKESGEQIDLTSVRDELDGMIKSMMETGEDRNIQAAGKLKDMFNASFTKTKQQQNIGEGGLILTPDMSIDAAMKQADNLEKVGNPNLRANIDASTIDFAKMMDIKEELASFANFNKNLSDLTPAQRRVMGKAQEKALKLYSQLDDVVSNRFAEYPELASKYADYKKVQNFLNKFKTGKGVHADYGDKAVEALTQMDSKSAKKIFKNKNLRDIASRFGVDIEKEADLVRTYNLLKDPSLLPTSGTATSTSRTISSGALGALAGSQYGGEGGGNLPIAAGVGAGLMLGSPQMMKNYFRLGAKGSDLVRGVREKVPMNQQMWKNIYMNTLQGNNEDQR